MLCAPVFIFTSSSSALLGRPLCAISIWLSLLAIFNALFWVYASCFQEKTDKTRKYSKSAILLWYENGRRRFLGAQSINTERASLRSFHFHFVSLAQNFKILFHLSFSLSRANLTTTRRRRQTKPKGALFWDYSRMRMHGMITWNIIKQKNESSENGFICGKSWPGN